ncbi:MAG: hypothetical protein AAGN46_09820 [Acidobacteriota bacterium]
MPIPSRLVVACLSTLSVLAASQVTAAAWDPFPEPPTGERAAIKSTLDGARFDRLRDCLREIESPTGARYWAAIVEVTSARGVRTASDSDAVPYVDALSAAWSERVPRFDPDRDLVVVVSTLNRGVAVRPGRLWAGAGFESAAVSEAIDASRFGELARRGNLSEGVCDLVATVDTRLAALPTAGRLAIEIAGNDALGPGTLGGLGDPARSPIEARSPALGSAGRRPSSSDEATGGAGCALVTLLLALTIGGAWLWRRRRRAAQRRADAEAELQRWKGEMERAADRLLSLERRYPLFFATGDLPWIGDTATLDRDTEAAVARLFALYSAGFDRSRHASARIEAEADATARLLRDTPLDVESRGEGKSEPVNPAEYFDQLAEAFDQAAELLETAAQLDAEVQTERQAVALSLEGALTDLLRREELQADSEASLAERDRLRQAFDETLALRHDPRRALEALRAVRTPIEDLRRRLSLGNTVLEQLHDEVDPRLGALEERLKALSATGLSLEEPGFDPTLRLDRARRQMERIRQRVAGGNEAAGAEDGERLVHDLEQLAEQIEVVANAAATLPSLIDDLEERAARLAARRPTAERALDALASRHRAGAIDATRQRLGDVTTLIGQADDWIADLRQDLERGHALAASEDLAFVDERLRAGEEVLDSLDQLADHLTAARRDAEQRRELVVGALPSLEEAARQPGPSAALIEELNALRREIADVEAAAAAERPDWADVAIRCEHLESDVTEWLDEARRHQDAFVEAEALAETLAAEADELSRTARAEVRDRPHVEAGIDEALERLRTWRDDLTAARRRPAREQAGAQRGGLELLDAGRGCEEAVGWARDAWHHEMGLVREAEAQLAAADQALARDGRRAVGHGVTIDDASARRHLDAARQARRSQRWEEVASEARRAQEALRDAVRRADQEAKDAERRERRRLQQERRDRRRRLAQMAATAATQMAATAAARAATRAARPIGGRRIPALKTPVTTNPKAHWTGRGSAASSFGRRRGGHSAGRGFGSSSGGTSW